MDYIIKMQETVQKFLYTLNFGYVRIATILMLLLTVVLATISIVDLLRSEQLRKKSQDVYDKSRENFIKEMKKTTIKSLNYDEIQDYINSSGLAYMTDYKITPLIYMLLRILLALFMMIIGLQVNLVIGLAMIPVGYFGVDFIINASDKADNEKMLNDIEDIYDTLRIQTKAGVYITSVLTDCYLVVKNKRLKSAFLKLTSDIAAKNDIDEALDKFKGKFRNEYINTLVIIIKQSMKTGQAAKMFEDIREQIADIDAAMLVSEKNHINSKIIAVQLIIYSSIIVISVFVTFITLTEGLAM